MTRSGELTADELKAMFAAREFPLDDGAIAHMLQKMVHKRREGAAVKHVPVYRERLWQLGFGCLIAGSLLSLAGFQLLGAFPPWIKTQPMECAATE